MRPDLGLQVPTGDSVSPCSVCTEVSTSCSPCKSSDTSSLAISVHHYNTHQHCQGNGRLLFLSSSKSRMPFSRQESGASLNPERVNETAGRKRELARDRAPPHGFLFCSLPDRDTGVIHFVHTNTHTNYCVVL